MSHAPICSKTGYLILKLHTTALSSPVFRLKNNICTVEVIGFTSGSWQIRNSRIERCHCHLLLSSWSLRISLQYIRGLHPNNYINPAPRHPSTVVQKYTKLRSTSVQWVSALKCRYPRVFYAISWVWNTEKQNLTSLVWNIFPSKPGDCVTKVGVLQIFKSRPTSFVIHQSDELLSVLSCVVAGSSRIFLLTWNTFSVLW